MEELDHLRLTRERNLSGLKSLFPDCLRESAELFALVAVEIVSKLIQVARNRSSFSKLHFRGLVRHGGEQEVQERVG